VNDEVETSFYLDVALVLNPGPVIVVDPISTD